MRLFTHGEYDAALAEAIERIPAATLDELGDAVIRVEQLPREGGLETVPGLRLVVYREPSLSQARDLEELHRLVRADLVRALVWQLDLEDETAGELSRDPVAF
jgi:hypothetical protein